MADNQPTWKGMMKPHFSEADLLETYYLEPGQSMPVMMHLASCSECAARYERLERKLREAAKCEVETRPETFWSRQRLAILRRTSVAQHSRFSIGKTARLAAAASLAFFLGGAVVFKVLEPALDAPPLVATSTPAGSVAAVVTEEASLPSDPWQSDELDEFREVVEWESWIDSKTGGQL